MPGEFLGGERAFFLEISEESHGVFLGETIGGVLEEIPFEISCGFFERISWRYSQENSQEIPGKFIGKFLGNFWGHLGYFF